MGVAPGSPVSASNTNQAFIDANADDTGIGKITLANTDPVSGAQVDNLQREHNAASSYTGMPLNSAKDVVPAWTSSEVGSSSDTLLARAQSLTDTFNGNTGHIHDGTDGQGPQIASADLSGVPLQGIYKQGTDISSVTGSSSNVTSQLTGQTPSNNQITKGVVVNSPFNLVFVRQATGVNTNDPFVDGSGNTVYGRLTESSGTWTLSYYVNLSGTETAYTFASSSNVRWYYQQLYDRIVDAPVYSDLSNIPSDNATADVVDATETQAGKVLLSNVAAQSVGSANAKGSGSRVSYENHVHQGVHSLGVYSDATKLFGDVDLEAGSGITLTRTSQRIKIDSSGSVGYQEVPTGTPNGSITTFGPLSFTPSDSQSLVVFIDGVAQERTTIWSYSPNSITFTTAPATGQKIYVFYLISGTPTPPPVVTGTEQVEYRTLSGAEDSAKKIILTATPSTPANVMLDLIGGGPQEFNVDYTVVANELRWNGYALDGVLGTGDKLRVHYII